MGWIIAGIILVIVLIILIIRPSTLYKFALDTKSIVHMPAIAEKGLKSDLLPIDITGYIGDDSVGQWFSQKAIDYYLEIDGLRLHAYELRHHEDIKDYVVLCHGYGFGADMMRNFALNLYDLGYNILLPEARAHGKSEGRYIGMGWIERYDVIEWIDDLIKRENPQNIGLFGVSMGASTVLNVTGESIPKVVRACVADCGYTSVSKEFEEQLTQIFKLPREPFLSMASKINEEYLGFEFDEADTCKQVEKSDTPTLFIHGDLDKFVPFEMHEILYEHAKCEKEKLVVHGANHGLSSSVNPQLYWGSVAEFYKKHFIE